MKIIIHHIYGQDREQCGIVHEEGKWEIRFTAVDQKDGNEIRGTLKTVAPDIAAVLKNALETLREHLENNIQP